MTRIGSTLSPGASPGTQNAPKRGLAAFAVLSFAGEHDVAVGDARVRDPALLARKPHAPAVAVGDRLHGRDVAARLGLGEGEGTDRLATDDSGQKLRREGLGAPEIHRVAAQALHHEGGVQGAAVASEPLPDQAQRRGADLRVGAPVAGGRHVAQQARLGEAADVFASAAVLVALVDVRRDDLGQEGLEAVFEGFELRSGHPDVSAGDLGLRPHRFTSTSGRVWRSTRRWLP